MERGKILGVIEAHVNQNKANRARWARYSKWYHSEKQSHLDEDAFVGVASEETDDISLESNYVYSYLDTMAANICPSNPQVSVTPHSTELKEYAQARESLINYNILQTDLADKIHTATIHAGIKSHGVLKTVWDEEKARAEVHVVPTERFFFDTSVDYEDTGYTIEATPLKEAEFNRRSGLVEGFEGDPMYDQAVAERVRPNAYPAWIQESEKGRWSKKDDASYKSFKWVLIYEVYDLENKVFYHFAEGQKEPLYEGPLPYPHVDNPYDIVLFNKNLHDSRGVSDIQLIEPVLERLNEIDTLELHHTLRTVPVMQINRAAFTDPESATDAILAASDPGDAVSVSLRQGFTMNEAITWSTAPTLSPHFENMRQRMTGLIEFVLGMPAYMRGDMGGSKVATEFALVDTATRTRNGTRSRRLNKVVTNIAKKMMGLWREELRHPQAQDRLIRVVGDGVVTELTPVDLDIDPEPAGDDPYEYETVAYSPTENHRMIQMQKLQQYMPVLLNNPQIDQTKLLEKLFELLGMESLVTETPQQPMMPEGATDGTQDAPPPGGDTLEGGGTPGGFDQAFTAGASPMADGPDPSAALPPV